MSDSSNCRRCDARGDAACTCAPVTLDDIRRDIAAALEDDKRATPGPWRVSMSVYCVKSHDPVRQVIASISKPATARPKDIEAWLPDAEFIADARTREPRLARALQAVLDALDEASDDDRVIGNHEASAPRFARFKWALARRLEKP